MSKRSLSLSLPVSLMAVLLVLSGCSGGIDPNVPSADRQPVGGSSKSAKGSSGGSERYASEPGGSGEPKGETRCGTERWSIKTLADPSAKQIDFNKINRTSVNQLRSLPVPGGKTGRNDPREKPYEFRVYQVNADLISAKAEEDSDIHLVIADPSDRQNTMIVELPAEGCTGTIQKKQMQSARKSFLRACGSVGSSRFADLSGKATIRGVAFFDVIHGQRGVAPNGIEIHPVLSFSGSCSRS